MKSSWAFAGLYGYFAVLGTASVVTPQAVKLASVPSASASGFWYENINHNTSKVYRNVKDMGAKGDGVTDDSTAIQKAISSGTTAGVVVYFPAGTYLVNSGFKGAAYAALIGDPTNKPVIKASASFNSSVLFAGENAAAFGLVDYFHQVKNLVFDTTAVSPTRNITLITWSVSQGTQLQNLVFNMPIGAAGHVGIASTGANSPTFLNDLHFNGGGIGLYITDTHYHFKNMYFNNTITGMKINQLVMGTGQGFRFEGVTTGLDTTANGTAHFNLIDSSATNTKTVVASAPYPYNNLVLENVLVDSTVPVTVQAGAKALLTGSVPLGKAWVKGNTYSAAATTPTLSGGELVDVSRSDVLINGTGFFHTVVAPTYEDVPASQVVNVRDRSVKGDGTTDDTAALQAIINSAASNRQILFFPSGSYIITDTIKIPAGSRLNGEAWSELLASGPKFADAKNPRVMVQVGSPGDVGVAQLTDFIFSIKTLSPGAILLEVNMAGTKPGDVGLFNSFFPIGIQKGTTVTKVYIEGTWVTDDGGRGGTEDGAGFLVESQNGVWMLGIGTEHSALYQMTIHNAKDVFVGVQISEPGYFEIEGGTGSTVMNPGNWAGGLLPGEPTYSWCNETDVACHVSLCQYVTGSTNIYLYSGAFWDFVCQSDTCVTNAAIYANNTNLYSFGVGVIGARNLISELGTNNSVVPIATRAANQGAAFNGFGASIMAAYLRQSGRGNSSRALSSTEGVIGRGKSPRSPPHGYREV